MYKTSEVVVRRYASYKWRWLSMTNWADPLLKFLRLRETTLACYGLPLATAGLLSHGNLHRGFLVAVATEPFAAFPPLKWMTRKAENTPESLPATSGSGVSVSKRH
jgi:hypothetical protein